MTKINTYALYLLGMRAGKLIKKRDFHTVFYEYMNLVKNEADEP